MRCSSCGADFSDPDVAAMMGQDPGAIAMPDVAGGSLAHGKFLGFSEDGLVDGTGLRKLALVGTIFLLAAFFIPVVVDFESKVLAWKATDHAPAIALLFPALAAILGIGAYAAPLLPWQRSAALLAAGIIGLGTLPFLAGLAAAPEKLLPLIWLGTIIGAWGLVLRGFDAQSGLARKLLIGGAVIAVAGYFLPLSKAHLALPIEIRFYLQKHIDSASAFSVYKDAFNKDPMVFFSSLYFFLPMVLLPLGAALAWAKPKGAWDKSGMLLRPIAWLAVLYVPIGFALLAFNLLGENQGRVIIERTLYDWGDVTSAALLGRLRLFALGGVFALWATLPSIALLRHFVPKASEPDASDAAAEAEAQAEEL